MKQRVVLFVGACVLTNIIVALVVRSLYSSETKVFFYKELSFPKTLHEIEGGVVNGKHNERYINWPNTSTNLDLHTHDCPCNIKFNQPLLKPNNHTHIKATDVKSEESGSVLPTIFMISPTYARLTQKSDLLSVCYTLMHVSSLVWIVIEDSDHKTNLVAKVLRHCKVPSVHLNAVTPEYYKKDSWRPRGVLQRNTGLAWIRDHYSSSKNCSGVVYFGDDDNKYNIMLFDIMRRTEKVSVWPVAFAGGLKYEGPECKDGKVQKWHVSWGAERTFPIDMAGFAIQLCLLTQNKNVVIGQDRKGKYSKPGFLETNILEQLVSKSDIKCRGLENEALVWHTKTQKPVIAYEGTNPSNPNLEV